MVQLLNKLKTHVDQRCLKILGKLRKVIKLGNTLLMKLVSDYLSENFRQAFGQFSENLKINRIPWENGFGLIS